MKPGSLGASGNGWCGDRWCGARGCGVRSRRGAPVGRLVDLHLRRTVRGIESAAGARTASLGEGNGVRRADVAAKGLVPVVSGRSGAGGDFVTEISLAAPRLEIGWEPA
jgi:hypothetical protein